LFVVCSIALSVVVTPALADRSTKQHPYHASAAAVQAKQERPSNAYRQAARRQAAARASSAWADAAEDANTGAALHKPRLRAASVGAGSVGRVRNASSSPLIAEARRYMGTNPTKRRSLWCGAFMNLVLERTGHPRGKSDLAKSFLSYGSRAAGPQVGTLAVMSRGRSGGHVGLVSGVDPSGNPIVISGNYNNRVAEVVYPRSRIIAYVVPGGRVSAAAVKHAGVNDSNMAEN
jgi:uncharacterized protein (TIGR02594 family)